MQEPAGITQEPADAFVSEAAVDKEERESVLFHEVLASGEIPPSLISYFETSKSRATVCEKLILEEVEDFTTSYEDLMNLPPELSKNLLKLNEQDISVTENINTSTDGFLLPETEAPVTDNVTASPRNEDELDDYGQSEKHQIFTSRISKISLTKEVIKGIDEHQQAHKDKRHFEELKTEEQIRQRENDFQMELKKLMEAEMLQQVELQLVEKRAQEKLEQELLLQQELISNLQKQVEEERRMMAEELKRMKEAEEKKKKEEEDRKKIEEEKIKRKKQRMEEEIRRKKMEEENKIILERRAEEERRLEQEQKKKEEEEERRKREEVKITLEEEKRKREEDRKRREEEKIKRELQMRKMEEDMRRKKEEDRKIKDVELKTKKEAEEKNKRVEEEMDKVEEEISHKEEETKIDECNNKEDKMTWMERDINDKRENKSNVRRQGEEDVGKREEGKTVMKVTGRIPERSIRKNEEDIRHLEEGETTLKENEKRDTEVAKEPEARTRQEEKVKEKNTEEERGEPTIERSTDEPMGKREVEKQRILDGLQRRTGLGHDMKNKVIKKEEEKITREEWKNRQEEEIKRQEEQNNNYRNMEEEIRAREEREGKAEVRKVEVEKENSEQKKKNLQNGGWTKRETDEEVSKYKGGDLKAENQWHKKEGNGISREQEERHEVNSRKTEAEREMTGSTGPSVTVLPEDSSTWSSSGLGSSGAHVARQHEQEKSSNVNSADQQDAAVQLCSSSTSFLPCPREQKRLSWMKDCISWSKLSLQNRRKQTGSLRGGRPPRRPAGTSSLPPLCPDTLLQATGCRSFQEVTTVTLVDLPGCNISTLVLCTQLQSLTLRRCGLKSLEGIRQLSQLCYIDVTENEISFVDCENMSSLRVLLLGYNKLTSIHGLRGADNLDVLELSHNNITRIAGLESMRRLQRLSLAHNQLISTEGLRDIYTLLHLNCSHNHLASVEGLENSALLTTLDLRSNSLSEPPSLYNHVLLRELHLDDNSISSLQDLATCWLPLMQNLSVAQNRLTQLPSMSDFVSLANLDLQFNCISELKNVCESLEGCVFLQDVRLTGNPLQQDNSWRSILQKALPGLRTIDDQETGCSLSPPAVQQIGLASDSFPNFCQAQLQQMNELLQQHSRELSEASSSLDAVKSLCKNFTNTLKLAEDQRFAHEYGDITTPEGQTTLERPSDMESAPAETLILTPRLEDAQTQLKETGPAVIPSRNNAHSYWTSSSTESWLQSLDAVTDVFPSEKRTSSSSDFKMAALCNQDLDLKNTAAVVIQQQWREYKDTGRNTLAGSSGDGANPEPGPSSIKNHSVAAQHYATVIQASWRGFSVRRRLASALAAVTFPSNGEDDTFEEVDLDEFVFDEAELEKQWTLQLSEDSLSRHERVSEQSPSLQFPGPLREPSRHTHATQPVWRPKQAWVPEEDPAGRVSPQSSHRKSPASSPMLSGISERSEKILEEWGFTDRHTALQMLKRAQNMKRKQQHKRKHKDPSVRLALFSNCNYQQDPVEARNRAALHSRNCRKGAHALVQLPLPSRPQQTSVLVSEGHQGAVCRTEQAENPEPVKQTTAQQRLPAQADRSSQSEHFLPELSWDILNGGRVQLVVDPVYSEQHRASGPRPSSSSSARQHNGSPHSICMGHARTDAPSSGVTAAPSVRERISFRDNPVQLSGGWGGGKKRNNVHK